MDIKKSKFGVLKNGEEVYSYNLKNEKLEVEILNYGGIITKLLVEDRNKKIENIVLGYDNIRDYEEKSPYFGAITGRVAGRIEQAKFKINEKIYKLFKNNGQNSLHGGIVGLNKRIWAVEKIKNGIELSYTSPHLEEGFPGKVEFSVKYILNNDSLEIEYSGIPDRETIINLTNHTYFNLSGECKEDILNHQLYINASKVAILDTESIPHGNLFNVEKTPFDFRNEKKIGKEIISNHSQIKIGKGYDHPFILNKEKDLEISLYHRESGRKLEVYTDRQSVVVYTGNYLSENEGILSCGKVAKLRLGVCLETQELPNNININKFKSSIYTPKTPYKATTIYKFIIK